MLEEELDPSTLQEVYLVALSILGGQRDKGSLRHRPAWGTWGKQRACEAP